MKNLFSFLLVLFALGVFIEIIPVDDVGAKPQGKVIQLDQKEVQKDVPLFEEAERIRSETQFVKAFLISIGKNDAKKPFPLDLKEKAIAQVTQPYADLHYDPV